MWYIKCYIEYNSRRLQGDLAHQYSVLCKISLHVFFLFVLIKTYFFDIALRLVFFLTFEVGEAENFVQ